ncbi:MAG: hypothetical protein WCF10_01100 [Polyangiales bacterium]
MKMLLSIAVVAIAASALLPMDAQADDSTSACNAIVGTVMGTAQYCWRNGCAPGGSECSEATNALLEFFATPGCAEAFANGDLNGLPGNASASQHGSKVGEPKHVQEVICGTLDDCGLCPAALALGVCALLCM